MLLFALLACSDALKDDDARTDDTGETDTGVTDTGPTDTGTPPDTDTATDTAEDTGAPDTGDADPGCRSTPAVADRTRAVLVSLPYDARGDRADTWAVLSLGTDGGLTDTGERLAMGHATTGTVAFTPDGSLAIAVTERGALAVYDVGAGRVVESAWDGGFYADSVTVDPSGEVAWVVDGNWPDNGGGLWRVALDCATGAPSGATRVLEAKNPSRLVILDASRAVLVGREVPGTATGDDVAWLAWGERPRVTGGADAFGDDEAIVSDAARVGDTLLLGDNSLFSGIPNRVARVGLDGTVAAPVEVEDPVALAPFPDGSARALVASGYGDALLVLDVAAGRTSTVSTRPRVQLPGSMAQVTRGRLAGLTLVSEVGGVRLVALSAAGATDAGVVSLGTGTENMVGAVGVAP